MWILPYMNFLSLPLFTDGETGNEKPEKKCTAPQQISVSKPEPTYLIEIFYMPNTIMTHNSNQLMKNNINGAYFISLRSFT